MIEYKCNICDKIFNRKCNYEFHINRKFSCKPPENTQKNGSQLGSILGSQIENIEKNGSQLGSNLGSHIVNIEKKGSQLGSNLGSHIVNIEKNDTKLDNIIINNADKNKNVIDNIVNKKTKVYQCTKCKYIYKHKSSYYKHIKNICKGVVCNNQTDVEKEEIFQNLLKKMQEMESTVKNVIEENKQLKDEVSLLKNNKSTNTINTNNGSIVNANVINNNTIQADVKLLTFGNEDLDHITNKLYKKIMKTGFNSVPNLIKQIHFSKEKPQNQNIYISNMRSNYLSVYNEDGWQLHKIDDYLEKLYYEKGDILIERYEQLVEKLDKPTIEKFERFINERDEDVALNNAKEEIKLILYNNKGLPEQQRKLIEK